MNVNHEPWFSRKGWFTIIMAPSGGLSFVDVPKQDVKVVRAMGGFLFDREGFAEEIIRRYEKQSNKKFMQYKKHRLFLPPRLCECQYSGWKQHE
jgi:hypothetical protein